MKWSVSFYPSSLDQPTFNASTFITEALKKLGDSQVMIITPNQAGSSPSAMNRFSSQATHKDGQPVERINTVLVAWDYLCKIGPQEKELEALGNEGWELCTVTPRPDGELWIFKRSKIMIGG